MKSTSDWRYERKVIVHQRVERKGGAAFDLDAGEALCIIESDGPQVVDCAIMQTGSHGSPLHLGQSIAINLLRSAGNLRAMKHLYTSPPDEIVLAEFIEDTVRDHCVWLGSRCSRETHRAKADAGLIPRSVAESGPTCQENIDGALAAIGAPTPYRGDVLNLFMRVDWNSAHEHGHLQFLPPASRVGDRVTLLAHVPLHVSMSACPNEDGPLNAGEAKGFEVEIWSGPDADRVDQRSTRTSAVNGIP